MITKPWSFMGLNLFSHVCEHGFVGNPNKTKSINIDWRILRIWGRWCVFGNFSLPWWSLSILDHTLQLRIVDLSVNDDHSWELFRKQTWYGGPPSTCFTQKSFTVRKALCSRRMRDQLSDLVRQTPPVSFIYPKPHSPNPKGNPIFSLIHFSNISNT